ncbi:hypothetical protein B0H63DRAFT_443673 [Podospora didyma]|uniref:Uncharacterized protein n=1 Tax=Podospora didyma TaxID=330526 RepID=A0AAE0U768_9PEZI|nr:hypothetical protein B0H63DRAFT_443673 [Podospora didyma]
MQLSIIIPFIAALALSTSASAKVGESGFVKLPRQDRYICDYRVWGQPGCDVQESNLGVGTITQSNLDICYSFNDDVVKSINLTNSVPDCSFVVFGETECQGKGEHVRFLGGCVSADDIINLTWSSYFVTCLNKAIH